MVGIKQMANSPILLIWTSFFTTKVTNFPENCAFIIDFSFTVWTKMSPLLAH